MIIIPSIKPVATRSPMAEYVEFGTTKSGGTWGGSNTTAFQWTGAPNLTVEWGGTGWSGGTATQTYTGTFSAGSYITTSVSRAVSGAGAKTIRVYPTDSSGRRIGKIISVTTSFVSTTNTTTPITSVDVKNARGLQYLNMNLRGTGPISSLDVSGMKELEELILVGFGNEFSTALTSLNVTGCTSLRRIFLDRLLNISSITGLNDTRNTLQSLELFYCSGFTSLDVSNFSALYNLYLSDCDGLTSLRAQNVMLYTQSGSNNSVYAYSLNGGANLQNTLSMTKAAVEQFYTDLATETTAFDSIIAVYGSGGWDANAAIATAKNYTVIGNVPP
jgi:hypothetical protein